MSGNTKTKSTTSARTLTSTAMLSAVAFILMYFEVAIPLMPSFIKFDFSDLPALIGAFALGPVYGVIICLIKNILHLTVSQSMFVGELSNFILGAIFVFTAGLIYQNHKTKKRAVIGAVVGAVIMGIVSVFSNYFVVYPVYYNFMAKEVIVAAYDAISYELLHIGHVTGILQCLLVFNVPFTIIKGLIDAVICMLIYKPLSPLLKGRM